MSGLNWSWKQGNKCESWARTVKTVPKHKTVTGYRSLSAHEGHVELFDLITSDLLGERTVLTNLRFNSDQILPHKQLHF